MTKSREGGHNEITEEAILEAARTGRDVCAILAEMLRQANTLFLPKAGCYNAVEWTV